MITVDLDDQKQQKVIKFQHEKQKIEEERLKFKEKIKGKFLTLKYHIIHALYTYTCLIRSINLM